MQKALIIHGKLEDLSDVLRIARCEGKKLLKVDKVRVKPIVYPYNDGYVVVVEAAGCSQASNVGSGKKA